MPKLERQGAEIQEIQSKAKELELLNQFLRNRDKLKNDAILQLSDQLVTLSTIHVTYLPPCGMENGKVNVNAAPLLSGLFLAHILPP
jgi:hypothetical protein